MKTLVVALLAIWPLLAAAPLASADTPTGTVTGTVRDASGKPVPDAFLSLSVNPDINVHYWANALGRYSILVGANSPVGPLCAGPGPNGPVYPGYPAYAVFGCVDQITVAPGATLVQDLIILPHGSSPPSGGSSAPSTGTADRGWIFGVVALAGTEAPVPGVTVQLSGTPLRATTDAAGRYQFPGLSLTDGANGSPTYTASIAPPAGYVVAGPASQQVTVQAAHGVEADFSLQPAPCRFVLGFKALHNRLPAVVGDCLDDEQHNPANGDALQHTTRGLLVWRKADNFTAFTDGYRTWVAGPNGIQERLNTQRFPREANPDGLPVVRSPG